MSNNHQQKRLKINQEISDMETTKLNCENCKYCKEIEEENGGSFCDYMGVWVTWSKDRPCKCCIRKD